MSWLRSWSVSLRIARREARRNKGRSALVLAMIGLPVLGLSFAAVSYDMFSLTKPELVDRRLAEIARGEPRVRLLMTLPGVSYVVALGLLAALGDVTRFRDGDHAASYLGLVPTTRQSGRK